MTTTNSTPDREAAAQATEDSVVASLTAWYGERLWVDQEPTEVDEDGQPTGGRWALMDDEEIILVMPTRDLLREALLGFATLVQFKDEMQRDRRPDQQTA